MTLETNEQSKFMTALAWRRLGSGIVHRAGDLWAVLRTTVVNYGRHECTARAAAIAYFILLSFFPLVFLLIVLSSSLLKSDRTQAAVFEFINRYLPGAAQLVQLNIDQLLRRRGLTSVLSILGLVWSGGNVFASIQHSLNAIWGIQESRSFWWQRLLCVASIGAILCMFILSLLMTAVGELISRLPRLSLGLISVEYGRVWGRVTTLAGFAPTILFIFAIYRLLSNAPLRWWEWIPGSILSALAWELGKQLFTRYVTSFQPYNLVFGSLGKFVAFVIWSYYTGVILLMGAELTLAWKQVRGV